MGRATAQEEEAEEEEEEKAEEAVAVAVATLALATVKEALPVADELPVVTTIKVAVEEEEKEEGVEKA